MDWVNNSLKKAETLLESVDARASRSITDVTSPEKVEEKKETKRKDLLHDVKEEDEKEDHPILVSSCSLCKEKEKQHESLIKQNISLGKEMEELQKEAQGTVIELQKQNEHTTEIKRMTVQMETLLI